HFLGDAFAEVLELQFAGFLLEARIGRVGFRRFGRTAGGTSFTSAVAGQAGSAAGFARLLLRIFARIRTGVARLRLTLTRLALLALALAGLRLWRTFLILPRRARLLVGIAFRGAGVRAGVGGLAGVVPLGSGIVTFRRLVLARLGAWLLVAALGGGFLEHFLDGFLGAGIFQRLLRLLLQRLPCLRILGGFLELVE